MATNTEQQKEAAKADATKAFRKLVIEKRERVVRKPELLNIIGLSDATVWRMERDGKFPKRLRLGGNSCGWLESEVRGWLQHLADDRVKPFPTLGA